MNRTLIEGTDIQVSRLSFGTGSLHHLFSAANRQELLAAAASTGMTHFDTSPYYGYGLAEKDLGLFLLGRRSNFTLTTKVGLYPWAGAARGALTVWAQKSIGKMIPVVSRPVVDWNVDHARTSLSSSLRRLRTDWIDFLLLHEPDRALIQTDEFLRWIENEHERGRVRCWGVAGIAENVAPWVEEGNPLAKVVQTRDSLDQHEADFMEFGGRQLQFTYGYLSAEPRRAAWTGGPVVALKEALSRNRRGSVIVSARHVSRVAQLAEATA